MNMKELISKITAQLGKYRLTFGDEFELQQQLSVILSAAGIDFVREFKLSAHDRLDFWVEPFVIEVKVGGSVDGHLRQIKRYNSQPMVAGTILIGTKPFDLPATLSGKPVALINVGRNRL